MPDPTALNDVLRLLGDVTVNVDQEDTAGDDALRKALEGLKAPLRAVVDAAGKSPGDARKLLRQNISFDKGTELREFFENVAASLITAQKHLDVASIDYSKAAAADGLPPSRFAIPKVTAELRFGFSNLSAKGINVFLFSSQQQREEHSESSVKFDLISTAPEPKDALLPGAEGISIVLGLRRDSVLDKLIDKIDAGLRPQLQTAEARALAAVFEYRTEGAPKFLILWPAKPLAATALLETWSFFAVAVLEGDALVRDVFEFRAAIREGGDILLIPSDADLKRLAAQDSEALRKLVIHLGDVLMNVCIVLGGKKARPPA